MWFQCLFCNQCLRSTAEECLHRIFLFPVFWCFDIWSLAVPKGALPSRVSQFLEIINNQGAPFQIQTSQSRVYTHNQATLLVLTTLGPCSRQTGTVLYPESAEIIQTSQSRACYWPHWLLSTKTTIKAHVLASPLPPDWTWCFPVCPPPGQGPVWPSSQELCKTI